MRKDTHDERKASSYEKKEVGTLRREGLSDLQRQDISRSFQTLVDSLDLDSVKQSQHHILGRLQDSNAVLSLFNNNLANCFIKVSADFSRNTCVLQSMKSDLDYIFLKLRYATMKNIKAKILSTYPDAFPDYSTVEALDRRPDLELPQ
ncbi:uncharacterized protein LOC111368294 [Olea europaea var. sylvestris]|uniref:uncharacterized protein LOC111368294 n=1 Tax=Olea europaea var. sylvestris TaxID=158386 RepID=UPI000C1D11C4|nr:uncharacterized protein LOC111368294 [Olea europaea var. sylvestris]